MKWKFIGIELGIDTGTLDTIEADYRKVDDRLREMINIWLKRASPRPTQSAVKAALQSEHVVLTAAGNHNVHKHVCASRLIRYTVTRSVSAIQMSISVMQLLIPVLLISNSTY